MRCLGAVVFEKLLAVATGVTCVVLFWRADTVLADAISKVNNECILISVFFCVKIGN
jgi:hypothetical protein